MASLSRFVLRMDLRSPPRLDINGGPALPRSADRVQQLTLPHLSRSARTLWCANTEEEGSPVAVTNDVSLAPDQRQLLQAVYDRFRAGSAWPTFISVDRPLRRAQAMDTGAVAQAIPESLLLRPRPGNHRPNSDDLLRLTIPGIAACDGSSDDVDHFVRLLRWLAEKEVEFEPGADAAETMPRITFAEIREHLGLGEADPGPLRRLYAMLQLDHWGLGGSGGTPDDWFVNVGPDIWRYRDVQTAADCAMARKSWLREGSFELSLPEELRQFMILPGEDLTASAPEEAVPDAGFYHVRISTKSKPTVDEIRLDLSRDELASRFVEPYREGRPIVINGTTIPIDDLAKLLITRTEQSSDELRPTVEAESIGRTYATPVDWLIADRGKTVTDDFITEPPGSSTVPLVPALPAVPSRRATPYVDEKLAAAIQAKVKSQLDCAKLLELIDELNDNYARENAYAAHALLRAILDHIPPILGCATFTEIANNYPWSRTDKGYVKRLLDFKLQGDDVLHRQISHKADLLGMDDLPPRVWLNRLLQECAEKL